jgi:hypothetical protein
MKEFSQAVVEKLGYYVYVLKDPRTSEIFYVGKGVGNRIFQHVADALEREAESDKLNLIREIKGQGLDVQHFILRHGISEELAFEIESASIDLIGIDSLTNKVKGHDSWERGLKSVDEVMQYYDAKEVEIMEPSIIININKLFVRFMTSEDLYNVTRSAWKVSEQKRQSCKYAIAAYRGLVREVYVIDRWVKTGHRWEFVGRVAEAGIRDKYLNHSLKNYSVTGSRNPIRYAGFK